MLAAEHPILPSAHRVGEDGGEGRDVNELGDRGGHGLRAGEVAESGRDLLNGQRGEASSELWAQASE